MKIPVEVLIDEVNQNRERQQEEQRPFLTIRDIEEEAYYRYIKNSQNKNKIKKNENNGVIIVQIWL